MSHYSTTQEWKPISGLPENWSDLAIGELNSYHAAWSKFTQQFKNADVLEEFNRKLRRAWAIETGIIEDIYHISEGLTKLLVEKGIESALIPHDELAEDKEQVITIIKDHEHVVNSLYEFIKSDEKLTAHFIRSIHNELLKSQKTVDAVDSFNKEVRKPLLVGQWRMQPNFSIDEHGNRRLYCPPEQIDSEINSLVNLNDEYEEYNVPPEVRAAWLHHRLTLIHPFEDGNGRVSRAVASLIFLRAKWFPLIVDRNSRSEYIDALRHADNGDLGALVRLFGECQKKALRMAMSLADDQPSPYLAQAIEAVGQRLRARKKEEEKKLLESCISTASNLIKLTLDKLNVVKSDIEKMLITEREILKGVEVQQNRSEQVQYYRRQIVETAKELGYFADLSTYRAWVRLRLYSDRKTEVIVSFHSFGTKFSGMFVVTAFMEHRSPTEDGIDYDGPYVLCNQEFKFAWEESLEDTKNRFSIWIEDVLLQAIHVWGSEL
jgi:Fic family protein